MKSPLDRQTDQLVAAGYPDLLGISDADLRSRVEPLRQVTPDAPFVLVVASGELPRDRAMEAVELRGKRGFAKLYPIEPSRFVPIDDVSLPSAWAYLIVDVDTGFDTLNVTPEDALSRIRGRGRSPLTIDEGIALATQSPDLLATRNAYSLLGSRCGDRRVPAIWISARRPRLGWCWAGNPHTWLGSASCGARIPPP